ncbi:MAG: ABC-2 transporter permease [Oscillospiraceae bacterium]|nr:ABC-2 transporter permease [Oscillospiraceae bacterium]MBR0207357.1 ABC-2 transporter permease [Oscillospiraceae bacterium]
MAKLLKKEFKLFTHPTSWMFLAFGAMMLIPGYPMYVVLFWATLGLFYACLSARENNDLYYTLLLPVRKRDAVRARGLYFALTELLQLLCCVPFAILRYVLKIGPNGAGMDVNIALFGLGLVLLGLFNCLFLPRLYKNPTSVGKPFLIVMIWVFVYILAAEACCFVVPFFRDVLDTPDPQHLGAKLIVFFAGAVLFALLTALGVRRAEAIFEKVDL